MIYHIILQALNLKTLRLVLLEVRLHRRPPKHSIRRGFRLGLSRSSTRRASSQTQGSVCNECGLCTHIHTREPMSVSDQARGGDVIAGLKLLPGIQNVGNLSGSLLKMENSPASLLCPFHARIANSLASLYAHARLSTIAAVWHTFCMQVVSLTPCTLQKPSPKLGWPSEPELRRFELGKQKGSCVCTWGRVS